jgi:hypothetical protein
MKKFLGDSWKTTLIGYAQFFGVTVYELFLKEGITHWGFVLLSAFGALLGKFAADSKQVTDVKNDVGINTMDIEANRNSINKLK